MAQSEVIMAQVTMDTMQRSKPSRVTASGAVAAAVISAPCFVSLLLFPLGVTVGMSSALYIFLDKWRYIPMIVAIVALVGMHLAVRKGSHFKPTKTVWVITVLVALFVVGEIVADPPWSRHAIIMRIEGG